MGDIQLITLADLKYQDLECFPLLDPAKPSVWSEGFSSDSLDWIDWKDARTINLKMRSPVDVQRSWVRPELIRR